MKILSTLFARKESYDRLWQPFLAGWCVGGASLRKAAVTTTKGALLATSEFFTNSFPPGCFYAVRLPHTSTCVRRLRANRSPNRSSRSSFRLPLRSISSPPLEPLLHLPTGGQTASSSEDGELPSSGRRMDKAPPPPLGSLSLLLPTSRRKSNSWKHRSAFTPMDGERG